MSQGSSDISLGVRWGCYFIITECPLMLGMENTAGASQGSWWDAGRELWLLVE